MASTLRKGSSGDEVRKLQEALNRNGYNLKVDGIFGDNTLNAVTKYQKSNGLSVDGIVGSQTWGKLTGGGNKSQTAAAPVTQPQTAAPQTAAPQTAVTPLGNSYNPQETTGTKADLTAIESKAPSFNESQAYKDAMSALQNHQAAQPGAYQSTFADRLNSLYEQIVDRGEYKSQYGEQIGALAGQAANRGEYSSPYADQIAGVLGQINDRGGYQSQYGDQIGALLDQYGNAKYESPYGSKIEELYDKVMNRGEFSYDFNADPLYQQYKDQYMRGGQRAMQDTMANAAALTGGYGNSYAATAGNLAYQEHLTGLNDVIPELQQAAYQRYADAGNDLINQLSITQGLDENAYGRYSDDMNRLLQQIQAMQGLDESEYGRYMDAGNELYNKLSALQGLDQDSFSKYQAAGDDLLNRLNALQGLDETAYGRYQDATTDLYNQLSATQGMEQDAYNKYRDQVGDYYTDLEYLTGVAGDQYNRDYAAYQDALDKYMADRDYYYGKSQDELAQQNYENELAAAEAKKSSGGGSSSKSSGGNQSSTSGDYKTVLNNAKNMTAQKAYEYVQRMVNSGVITQAEGDKILNVEVGMDTSEYENDVQRLTVAEAQNVLYQIAQSEGLTSASREMQNMLKDGIVDGDDAESKLKHALSMISRR